MSQPLLTARGVGWRAAGREVLREVDFTVRAGESWSIIGPNGAGKTTLLRLLTGVLQPSSGTLTWEDAPFSSLPRKALARSIAYVPQIRPARVPLSVEEVVLLGRYPHLSRGQAPGSQDFEAARRALDTVGIAHLAHRPLDQLSGGERQSAYIAAALAQEPRLLVLDEPTTHLDPRHQRTVARLLLRLHGEGQRSIVVATHDLNFASLLADRVLALAGGQVHGEGPPSELLAPEALSDLFDAPFDEIGPFDEPDRQDRPRTLLRMR